MSLRSRPAAKLINLVMVTSSKSKVVLPTPAELRLLNILWRLKEGTIEDLLLASAEKPPLNYKTVQTILRIMESKKLVTHRLSGRAFLFQPLVKRSQVNRLSIRSLLDRYFKGSRSELLLNLLDDKRIDVEELQELEELIRRHRKSKTGALNKLDTTKNRR
jgi:BlaI family penicillinase repressor